MYIENLYTASRTSAAPGQETGKYFSTVRRSRAVSEYQETKLTQSAEKETIKDVKYSFP